MTNDIARRARMFGTGVGNTPSLDLPDEIASGCLIRAKLEKFNPFSSIKDRAAWYMIEGARERGELGDGEGTIVEATSGNTGIALAGFATAAGYRSIIVMPDSASEERIALLRYLGAEVTLTPSKEGYAAAIAKAEELRDSVPDAWFACQHENPDNIAAHYESTGPELWDDCEGSIDILVCGVGTGGTITGVARYLKEKNPDIHVVAAEPESSAVLSGEEGGIHKIYGWNGGFVAATTDRSVIDEVVTVSDESSWQMARKLSACGIVVGISSGGSAVAAVEVAGRQENRGKRIATIFPDSGERYISVLTA